jgi:hypothetical protein
MCILYLSFLIGHADEVYNGSCFTINQYFLFNYDILHLFSSKTMKGKGKGKGKGQDSGLGMNIYAGIDKQ